MRTDSFRGKDYMTLRDWDKEQVETMLDVAFDLKRRFALREPHDHLLRAQTLFMIFYNQSLRTRNTFEAGMTQLGGHAHFLDPTKIYTPALEGREIAYITERVSDVARVLSRTGDGIAIRCYGDPVDWEYGGAHEMMQEFARWSDIPVINMECDKYHPCQALADVMTVKEKFGTFKGTKFVMSWAYSPSVHKPRAVPQSVIIAASLMGCETVLAHPPEMELDPEIIAACEANAKMNRTTFSITNDFESAFEGAHVVYPKAWAATPIFPPPVGENDPDKTLEIFNKYKNWKMTSELMETADQEAVYMHCLPADRGFEVNNDVMDRTDVKSGWRSAIFDEAENRLHAHKAIMTLLMGGEIGTVNLSGRDLVTTQDWSPEELLAALNLAVKMKGDRYGYTSVLKDRTFFMFFYNPSVRTRQSFECAATELGGHAQFLEPKSMRLKTATTAGETIEDAARVMSRYACGLGIRILEDKVSAYGEGEELIREYAQWAEIPVVSMAHDKFHPCQGLADIMGWIEWLTPGGGFDPAAVKGKKLLVTWGHGALARSLCSIQEAMLIGSRFGMDVTVAAPEGYDLDGEVIKWTHENCKANGATLATTNDVEAGYKGAHVVYSRNWMSPKAYVDGEFQKQQEIEKALKHTDWICDATKMALTEDAIFTHPMPIDRGHEVTDDVASGERSCIYDVAENRLHAQKAVMALTMGDVKPE